MSLKKMKNHTHLKPKGTPRANPQQVIFELKHRVVLALNKLADRDTYQIGVEELEKTAECLTSEGIVPFLSCILDTDSEQKSAVRKECIRMMGVLTSFHGAVIGQHLGKMVGSIVKRLKDTDSVVRDACVETFGVLASKLGCGGSEGDGVFVMLVKPLFEALGEQNRQVQSGSALCLARVIESTPDPPVPILERMLTRTIKLLKNPHFMAKPAVIELNKSILMAGGAPTHNTLSTAITSIQAALKNSDWNTRKAASVALGDLVLSGGSYLGSFKASCIRSLDCCRFDKVKPVRDAVLHSLQLWKSTPGSDTPEPSEAGSSIKGLVQLVSITFLLIYLLDKPDVKLVSSLGGSCTLSYALLTTGKNLCGGDYSDVTSVSDFGWKDATLKKIAGDSINKRGPLSNRRTCQNFVENPQCCKLDDWHVEIAVPKTKVIRSADAHNEESEGSSVTKMVEGMSADVISMQDSGFDYVPRDDKQDCSSVSNLVIDNFESKRMAFSHDHGEDSGLVKPMGRNREFAVEDISCEERMRFAKMQDRQSLESTITESSSRAISGCCVQTANEMVSIRKQLLEIESKQSSLMELLQVFTTNTMESLSMIQSKVLGLEYVVDKIAEGLVHGRKSSDLATTKLLKSKTVASPRISTSSPRPSIDIHNRQSSILPSKERETVGETYTRSRLSNFMKQDADIWADPTAKVSRKPVGKSPSKISGQETPSMAHSDRKMEPVRSSTYNANARQNGMNILWIRVKGFLHEGDLDSAYTEALCSGDELVLIELVNRTGPVLESLSHRTANDVLSTLVSYFLEQRFMHSIIPWLQQVVELSSIHGPNYLVLSAKARIELLSAIQEAAKLEYLSLAERRSVAKLAMKLQQVWGKILLTRDSKYNAAIHGAR
ncbi:HEAT repeat [Dillenia turbinata]|uniref:HEAT repeat n=1 Tax=Dillenia turbinata TaxID=194707 RepID=A0AAN8ZHD3_9MAGN